MLGGSFEKIGKGGWAILEAEGKKRILSERAGHSHPFLPPLVLWTYVEPRWLYVCDPKRSETLTRQKTGEHILTSQLKILYIYYRTRSHAVPNVPSILALIFLWHFSCAMCTVTIREGKKRGILLEFVVLISKGVSSVKLFIFFFF